MDWIRTLLSRCVSLFRRRKLDAELDEELCLHLDLAIEDNIRRGMTIEEARTAALRAFGGLSQAREAYRVERGFAFVESLLWDVRYALRQLRRSPMFALTTVITLALGIGANTAVFSVLNTLLLRPLPFPDAGRLMRIYSTEHDLPIGPSPLDARDFARRNHTFEKLAVFDQWRKNVFTSKDGDLPESLHVGLGPVELFQALGVRPILGRLFTEDEGLAGRNHVALLTEPFWQSHYGRNPNVVGQTININGLAYSIIGVIPDTVPGWLRGIDEPIEIWEPFLPTTDIWDDALRSSRNFTAIGLLKPGTTVQQAQADLQTIAANLATVYPVDRGIGVLVQPLVISRAGDLRPQLYLVMGAVSLILLIACSNLAALLLARDTARRREFAMRAALGARRTVLIRQILVETLIVCLIGGIFGVALASAVDLLIRHEHPKNLPLLAGANLDWRVLVFASLIALGTSLVFGLAPAVLNARINLLEALRDGARGASAPARHLFRRTLAIGQIALSLVLTVTAALCVQTVLHLVHQDMGFRVDHLLKAHFFLPDEQYRTPDAKTRFCDLFSERLRGLPGVHDVSITSIYPPYERWNELFSIENHPISRPEDVPSTFFGVTDAAYLRTAGIPIVEGRDFSVSDREDTPVVAIVNRAFARRFFPADDPIGKRIVLGAPRNLPIQDTWLHDHIIPVIVIGVMSDSKDNGPASPVAPQLIALFRQMPMVNFGFKDVIVRSDIKPQLLADSIQQQLHELNPRLPLSEIEPMSVHIEEITSDKRFTSLILSAFAGLGLVLALTGVYGVVSYLVAQRNQELAIRLALGAHRPAILWLIVREGLVLAVTGIAIGLAGTALVSRGLAGVLYGVSALDVPTLGAASTFLLAVALLASALPARRAASVDPMQALRSD